MMNWVGNQDLSIFALTIEAGLKLIFANLFLARQTVCFSNSLIPFQVTFFYNQYLMICKFAIIQQMYFSSLQILELSLIALDN